MLDIKFIRENPGQVKEACQKRGVKCDIDQLLEVDKKRRETLQATEDMKAQKNKASKEIAAAENKEDKKAVILQMKELDKGGDRLDKQMKELNNKYEKLMYQIPNIPFPEVPVGDSEKDNVVIREIGEKPKFDFEPKDYLEIAEKLDIIDVKRAAKVSGSRFGYLKGGAVLLEFALVRLAFDTLTKEGFIPILPPVMIRPEMMRGMGYIDTEDDTAERYFLSKDNLFLVGTSEQSVGPMHQDEVFGQDNLPRRYVAFSTCFREEAGSYGKDTKGILRVHQFDKVEMFSYCQPDQSKKEHEYLLSLEEKLMKLLNLHFRVVNTYVRDLARPAAAKFDIETWFPAQEQYRETHSVSNCTDFQARRLNIRYKDKKGQINFVHTLNGTVFSQRPILAILENYQQKDGSVAVPEVLQKYMGGLEIIRAR